MKFSFSIGDLAVMLGKSPVTIRSWERKGLVRLPRVGGKRRLTVAEARVVAKLAYDLERISEERYLTLIDVLTMLKDLEEDL